jgi:hypothetical protein
MDKYIYINEKSLSKELCNIIVEKLNDENTNLRDGVTTTGLNKNVKITLDFCIENNDKWREIYRCLETELNYNLQKYLNQLNNEYVNCNECQNTTVNSLFFFKNEQIFFKREFTAIKYLKNTGRYIYHNDFATDEQHNYRIITFLWYLNDVSEGGTTDFFSGKLKIKPTAGKLVLFPASWTFPHCGKMPISSDKYVISGWIWKKQ